MSKSEWSKLWIGNHYANLISFYRSKSTDLLIESIQREVSFAYQVEAAAWKRSVRR